MVPVLACISAIIARSPASSAPGSINGLTLIMVIGVISPLGWDSVSAALLIGVG
jgi:hypothetical protein